jgi:hypothetical protein
MDGTYKGHVKKESSNKTKSDEIKLQLTVGIYESSLS